MPLFSALIAMALLGEQVSGFHFIGGLLILAGVIMAQTLTRPLVRAAAPHKNAQRPAVIH